jgi:hypothetical protein
MTGKQSSIVNSNGSNKGFDRSARSKPLNVSSVLCCAPGQSKRSAARLCGVVKMAKSKHVAKREPIRTFRLIGAVAALLAVLGIAILVFWLMIRLPRF